MTPRSILAIASTLCLLGSASATLATVDALRGVRRVLLVSAPDADDRRLTTQRSAVTRWRQGAEQRDLTTVQVVGDRVEGTDDDARSLRRRYGLPRDRFAALLIGKDGHVALRSAEPIDGDRLEGTIDAMPMRRAGQR